MNLHVTHIIVHTPEQVRGIVDEAIAIADEKSGPAAPWLAVFEQSCALLGQRVTNIGVEQAIPLDLGAIRRGVRQ